MKTDVLKKLTTEELVERFRAVSASHGRLLNARNTRAANKEYDAATAIRNELRSRGKEAEPLLLQLLKDPEEGTRYWAATAVMRFAPVEAEHVLAALSEPPLSLMGLSASMTLDAWKKGTFKPD